MFAKVIGRALILVSGLTFTMCLEHKDSYEWSRESPMDLDAACAAKPGAIFVISGYDAERPRLLNYGHTCGSVKAEYHHDLLSQQIAECRKQSLVFVNAPVIDGSVSIKQAQDLGHQLWDAFFGKTSCNHARPFGDTTLSGIVLHDFQFIETMRSVFEDKKRQNPMLQALNFDARDTPLDFVTPAFVFYVDFTSLLHGKPFEIKDAIENWESESKAVTNAGWFITFHPDSHLRSDVENFSNTYRDFLVLQPHFLGRHYRFNEISRSLFEKPSFIDGAKPFSRVSYIAKIGKRRSIAKNASKSNSPALPTEIEKNAPNESKEVLGDFQAKQPPLKLGQLKSDLATVNENLRELHEVPTKAIKALRLPVDKDESFLGTEIKHSVQISNQSHDPNAKNEPKSISVENSVQKGDFSCLFQNDLDMQSFNNGTAKACSSSTAELIRLKRVSGPNDIPSESESDAVKTPSFAINASSALSLPRLISGASPGPKLSSVPESIHVPLDYDDGSAYTIYAKSSSKDTRLKKVEEAVLKYAIPTSNMALHVKASNKQPLSMELTLLSVSKESVGSAATNLERKALDDIPHNSHKSESDSVTNSGVSDCISKACGIPKNLVIVGGGETYDVPSVVASGSLQGGAIPSSSSKLAGKYRVKDRAFILIPGDNKADAIKNMTVISDKVGFMEKQTGKKLISDDAGSDSGRLREATPDAAKTLESLQHATKTIYQSSAYLAAYVNAGTQLKYLAERNGRNQGDETFNLVAYGSISENRTAKALDTLLSNLSFARTHESDNSSVVSGESASSFTLAEAICETRPPLVHVDADLSDSKRRKDNTTDFNGIELMEGDGFGLEKIGTRSDVWRAELTSPSIHPSQIVHSTQISHPSQIIHSTRIIHSTQSTHPAMMQTANSLPKEARWKAATAISNTIELGKTPLSIEGKLSPRHPPTITYVIKEDAEKIDQILAGHQHFAHQGVRSDAYKHKANKKHHASGTHFSTSPDLTKEASLAGGTNEFVGFSGNFVAESGSLSEHFNLPVVQEGKLNAGTGKEVSFINQGAIGYMINQASGRLELNNNFSASVPQAKRKNWMNVDNFSGSPMAQPNVELWEPLILIAGMQRMSHDTTCVKCYAYTLNQHTPRRRNCVSDKEKFSDRYRQGEGDIIREDAKPDATCDMRCYTHCEDKGVTTERLPSLAAQESWRASKAAGSLTESSASYLTEYKSLDYGLKKSKISGKIASNNLRGAHTTIPNRIRERFGTSRSSSMQRFDQSAGSTEREEVPETKPSRLCLAGDQSMHQGSRRVNFDFSGSCMAKQSPTMHASIETSTGYRLSPFEGLSLGPGLIAMLCAMIVIIIVC